MAFLNMCTYTRLDDPSPTPVYTGNRILTPLHPRVVLLFHPFLSRSRSTGPDYPPTISKAHFTPSPLVLLLLLHMHEESRVWGDSLIPLLGSIGRKSRRGPAEIFSLSIPYTFCPQGSEQCSRFETKVCKMAIDDNRIVAYKEKKKRRSVYYILRWHTCVRMCVGRDSPVKLALIEDISRVGKRIREENRRTHGSRNDYEWKAG